MTTPPETALRLALHAHATDEKTRLEAYALAVAIREAALPVDALTRVAADVPRLAINAADTSVNALIDRLAVYRQPARSEKRIEVTFDNLNEGYNGDYDQTDPADVQLLRCDVTVDGGEDGEEGKGENLSMCTLLPATLNEAGREQVRVRVITALAPLLDQDRHSPRRAFERLISALTPEDLLTTR